MQTQVASAAFASVIALAFSMALLDRWLRSNGFLSSKPKLAAQPSSDSDQPNSSPTAPSLPKSPSLSSSPIARKIRSKHLLAWLASMLAFAVASVALWAGAAFGWDIATFRVFYLFGAILSVPPLGLGTLYLLSSEKTADRCAIAVAVASVFAIGVLAAAPTTGRLSAIGLPNGADVFTALPRLLAAIASIAGSLVVIGGAIWTLQQGKKRQATQLAATQHPTSQQLAQPDIQQTASQEATQPVNSQQETSQPTTDPAAPQQATPQPASLQVTARIKAGVSLIALGTIILGLGGALNSVAEEMTAFALALAIGAAFLFTGFLLSTTPKTSPHP